jgi:hypothetical protein
MSNNDARYVIQPGTVRKGVSIFDNKDDSNPEINHDNLPKAPVTNTTSLKNDNLDNSIEIEEIDAEKKIYKTRYGDKTNYAKVILDHNQDNNTNTTYIIEVREDVKFEKIETPRNIEELVKNLKKFVKENEENERNVGGKKRNTSKIHKKSKKRIIKYKRNTKKSKK